MLYFGSRLRKIKGFISDLGDLGKIFTDDELLENLLTLSKRFTDQLNDMLRENNENDLPLG